ncbi:hypothetical protein L1987_03111 [Smallanthus sonchifolius]|uniref:Uncharacterized protein n=1 Tax=Smallanthus sonchifolius TaxID=185202 RepID=A0ACB9K9T8_9ASTR|nr:hypothetical protein L1987_03111 [Smallanthus sonchifolius]
MESCRLEIVLHSAKDLCNVKHFGTMDLYAKVWFAGGGIVSETRTTPTAKNSGSCPVWEFPMEFDSVPMKTDNVLFCEIQHDGKLFDRKIGEVQVPFKDLLAGDGSRKNVSYPVKIHSGEVMGLIILSHKFSEPVVTSSTSGTENYKDSSKKDKEHTPIKKVQGKKKDGMMKRVAKSVGTQVASKAVLLAGTAAVLYALDADQIDEGVEDENEGKAEDPNED